MTCKTGIFITFEGGEGSGKSTQIGLLQNFIISTGMESIITREPGGTLFSEQIRPLLGVDGIDANEKLLLLWAARINHLKKKIEPALEAGQWVLCDRFIHSTIAYQGYGQGLDLDSLYTMEKLFLTRRPDLTFFLDVNPKISLKRAHHRDKALNQEGYFESLPVEFHQRVYAGFQTLAFHNPNQIISIPAESSASYIHEQIKKHVSDLFLVNR